MVSYDGPPRRTVQYQSLDSMRSLLASMVAEVNGGSSYRLGATRKGLG